MTVQTRSQSLDLVAIGALSKMDAQPVLAAKSLFMGQMVAAVSASGFMSDPAYGTTGAVLGFAESDSLAVAGESSGDRGVNLWCGAKWIANFATRPVVLTDIGAVCFASDNATVSGTSTDGPVAGIVCGVDTTLGVLVYCHPGLNYLLSQATLAADLLDTTAGKGAKLVAFTDSGNKTTAADVDAALDAIFVDLCSATSSIDLDVLAMTKADGTALAKYSAANDGTVGIYGDGTKVIGLRWNNTGGTTDTVAKTFDVPPDCDLTVAPVIEITAAKTGATLADATTFVCGMYAQTPAAAYDAGADLGVTTGAMTGDAVAKTVQQVTGALTVFPGLTSRMTLTINPTAAKLGTDDVIVTAIKIIYTRKLRTT